MRALVLVAAVFLLAPAAHGQAAPRAEWIRPEEVPTRADSLQSDVEAARPSGAKREKLEQIERGLKAMTAELADVRKRIDAALASSAPLNDLADLEHELDTVTAPLSDWEKTLGQEDPRVAALLAQLEKEQAIWAATSARPEIAGAGPVVERRVHTSLGLATETREHLLDWRDRVLSTEERVAERRTEAKEAHERLGEAQRHLRRALLVPDRPPLWRGDFAERLRAELPRVPANLAEFSAETRAYLMGDARQLLVQAVMAVAFALLFRQVARHARRRTATEVELLATTRILERPVSIGLLLALLATPWLHPLAPLRFRQLLAVIALFPVARIVRVASERTSRVALAGLFALLLLDRLRISLTELEAVSQGVYLFTLFVAAALSLRVWRRGGLPGEPATVRRAALAATVTFSLALLAEVGGWSGLSDLLGRGALTAALAAVYVWAAVAAVDALLAYGLRSPRFARFGLAPIDGRLAERRARRLVQWLGVIVWVYAVLTSVGLVESASDAFAALLSAGVSIGALSLTLGGILGFAFTILAAPIIARSIDLVLERVVYPRARLPRGIPYALSTLVRYAVYTLAFLVALGAAGVHLSQLSIMLGGLGVGVGLGLQDIVKNFAAGLTLLLERRVHVGDVVQIPDLQIFGRVLEIGMRAALVRNWDGAEVVVPNGDLVASAVTNWTLSDQLRRIEVPVGVAYGTDPERVLKLLTDVAAAHADVVETPPPQALFSGFGDSSLDFVLRAWTDAVYDRTFPIRSELVVGIHRALREAGITIPFPQRDLNLAAVSPEARALFEGSRSR